MKIVGEQLENLALSELDLLKKDLFGRSAFNRFYYSAFLVTRKMLGELDPKWKHTNHKELPTLLVTGVCRPVINKLKQSEKKGLINKSEFSSFKTTINYATGELSKLLRQAYDLRVVADYEPEQMITIENKVIFLNSYKLTSANSWEDQANSYCKNIRKVWKESGLA